ncbi:hypothetical protein B0J13DRAFT_561065 [Dactylonectria estremocensis]|uniref:Uncharacterized protein n=1 Tax=Dactylonectria estremocensis TaxID=1079267 RepID=A0A9P9IWC5_9HYPO|nr:hypothetical protein B0J13DRAFT_561065 [Dactylonectria estremocensis]
MSTANPAEGRPCWRPSISSLPPPPSTAAGLFSIRIAICSLPHASQPAGLVVPPFALCLVSAQKAFFKQYLGSSTRRPKPSRGSTGYCTFGSGRFDTNTHPLAHLTKPRDSSTRPPAPLSLPFPFLLHPTVPRQQMMEVEEPIPGQWRRVGEEGRACRQQGPTKAALVAGWRSAFLMGFPVCFTSILPTILQPLEYEYQLSSKLVVVRLRRSAVCSPLSVRVRVRTC